MENPHKQVFLESIDLFSELPHEEVEKISRNFHLQTRPRGAFIFLEGGTCEAFYIIAAGKVRLFETSLEGKQQSLFVVRERGYFDVLTLIDQEPHPIAAKTMSDVRLYVIHNKEMLDLTQRFPSIASNLLHEMARMLSQMATLIGDLSFGCVATRLSRLILEHAHDEGITTPEGIHLPWEMTQLEIAHLIGTSREVVSRILHRMQQEHLIHTTHDELVIDDLKRLKERTFSHK